MSIDLQLESIAMLTKLDFRYLLPGHGRPGLFQDRSDLQQQINSLFLEEGYVNIWILLFWVSYLLILLDLLIMVGLLSSFQTKVLAPYNKSRQEYLLFMVWMMLSGIWRKPLYHAQWHAQAFWAVERFVMWICNIERSHHSILCKSGLWRHNNNVILCDLPCFSWDICSILQYLLRILLFPTTLFRVHHLCTQDSRKASSDPITCLQGG